MVKVSLSMPKNEVVRFSKRVPMPVAPLDVVESSLDHVRPLEAQCNGQKQS